MSALTPPRFGLPIMDANGHVTREWYQFLVNLAKAVDNSPTSADDLMTVYQTDVSDSVSLQAAKRTGEHLLFAPIDPIKPVDNTLLGLWPGSNT